MRDLGVVFIKIIMTSFSLKSLLILMLFQSSPFSNTFLLNCKWISQRLDAEHREYLLTFLTPLFNIQSLDQINPFLGRFRLNYCKMMQYIRVFYQIKS